jgi:signal transduction histidine kinase
VLKWLDDLISANVEEIASRMSRFAVEPGAGKDSSAREEMLRKSLSSILSSLLSGLRSPQTEEPSSEPDPARERYPFCAAEAGVRRSRGEPPGDFLRIVGYCQLSCLEVIDKAAVPSARKEEAIRFVERYFERLALDFCLKWCRLAEDEAGILRENQARALNRHGMELLAAFAAGVAHEVRNPLHALMSLADVLKQELKDNSDADIYLHHIRNQIDRLSLLMKDLLQVGKPIEPSRIRPERLSEVCLAAINTWKDSSSADGHTISFVRQPGDEETWVLVDGLSLQQALLNLLENAAQHSPAGSEIEIAISGTGKEFVKMRVRDGGSGIPEELRQKIFEPFFSTRRGGTGLGLTMAKNALESQGGSIAAWSNDPPPGSTIEVWLPLVRGGDQ